MPSAVVVGGDCVMANAVVVGGGCVVSSSGAKMFPSARTANPPEVKITVEIRYSEAVYRIL